MLLKTLNKEIISYSLLILIIVYYKGLSLFYHSHIVNGTPIIHSHPYNTGTEENPAEHNHTEKDFLLIQIFSNFLTIFLLITFKTQFYKNTIKKCILQKADSNYLSNILLNINGLRAPPY